MAYCKQDSVSLAKLKEIAKAMLPVSSILRSLIVLEPDELPKQVALAKLEIFVKILYREMGKR
jgi:hypothetical protein